MLVLPLTEVQPWGGDYAQAQWVQAMNRWFVRGQSFTQEQTAKRACQKLLDAPDNQDLWILVKSESELTLWQETQAVPAVPTPVEAKAEVKLFRGQVVKADSPASPADKSPVEAKAEVKLFRGQVVKAGSPASPVDKSPRVYRGKSY